MRLRTIHATVTATMIAVITQAIMSVERGMGDNELCQR